MFDLSTLIGDAAARHPDSLFVFDHRLDIAPGRGTEVTYRTMHEIVERTAALLRSRGVGHGDTVVVYKPQNPDLLPLACAIARVGAVPAMLAPGLRTDEATQLISTLQPRFVITGGDRSDDLDAAVSLVRAEDIANEVDGGWGGLYTSVPPPEVPAAEDTYLITHTSGTTGLPKLVPQARRGTQMPITIQATIARFMRWDEPAALAVSFVHGRTFSAFAVAVRLGVKLLLISDPAAKSALDLLRTHGPAAVETHPNMAMAWEAELRRDPTPFAGVRLIISTFDAIHPRTVRTLMGAAGRPNAVMFQSYGQTETGPVTQKLYRRKQLARFDGREVGRRFVGLTKVRILDDAGRRVRRGQVGAIGVHTKGLGLDYLGEHRRYVENFRAGWWLMGDHGRVDRRGRLFLEDRTRDRIPGIDSVLRVEDRIVDAIPAIREAVLVGDTTNRYLVYVTYDGQTVEEDELLAAAGIPDRDGVELVELRWDQLPLTSTWKVRRAMLFDQLSDGTRATPR